MDLTGGSTADARGVSGPQGRGARLAATRALSQQASRFPDCLPEAVILDKELVGLDARDAALAHRIYTRAMQRWLTLAAMLDRCLDQPFQTVEARVQGVLVGGAAQLFFLDRVPAHAVLDESVEIAKTMIRPGAGGLVNAVLRKLATVRQAMRVEASEAGGWEHGSRVLPLADGGRLIADRDLWPAGSIEGFSAAVSLPVDVLERWEARYGLQEARRLASHALCDPPVILNTMFAGAGMAGRADLDPHRIRGHHVHVGTGADLRRLLAERHDVWVQDPASAEAVRGAAEQLAEVSRASKVAGFSPRRIVDLCAGQGTKTLQLLATFPGARVTATDVDFRRLETLRERLKDHPRATVKPHAELVKRGVVEGVEGEGGGDAKADLVLIDVPCSNTGVLPRRIEARYRMGGQERESQLGRLIQTQREIARVAAVMLAPEGWLLYSTCSLEEEENEMQAAWIEKELGFRAVAGVGMRSRDGRRPVRTRMPTGLPGEAGTAYSDGSYWALLQKKKG